ncbi:MAG: PAS domain S-box protein, partial [Anaerolineae bacterium]|nr:PAS domain S-box protein [Anaerolineae bacterium]
LFGVLALASGIPVGNGFIIDGRIIILAIAGSFTGAIPAVIAALIMIGYRLILGGAGALPAIPSFITAVIISLALFPQLTQFTPLQLVRRLLLMGLIGAVQSLFWIALLGGTQSSQIVALAAFPLLLFTPLGTVLLGVLLAYQKQQAEIASALRASEERYRVVVTSLNEGIILQNAKGEIRTTNPATEAILGLTVEQIAGGASLDPRWQAIHEDGSPFVRDTQPSVMALRTGKSQTDVLMGIHKPDETVTWINVHAQPLFSGKSLLPEAVLTTFTDITEVRKAHEKLRQERDLLRTLIDHTPDYIFLKDAQGRFILTNTAHAYAAGNIQPEELIGKTAFDVFSPELASQFHEDDQKIMHSGEPLISAERETVDAHGDRKTVLTTKIPWRDKDGQILGLVGISRDVTERKQLESQTVVLAAEQERVRVLQRFIADMSHDFRTPLSIINSSTYLLRKLTDPEKREEKLKNIELQSDRMLKLLDDLLEMGRLDEKKVDFQFSTEVINPLIQMIVNNFQSAAALKQQTLEFIPDPALPSCPIDALKVSRAIINLVQNAISYTQVQGKITLSTRVEDKQVLLSIADNGIGISEEALPHIFERFYRVDGARTTSTGGSGLGLPIAKKIIEEHNGSISVESKPNQGTTFMIKLPLEVCDVEKIG